MATDRSWLATVMLRPLQDGQSARVQLLVPAGVHLASGLYVEAAKDERLATEWLVCTPESCRAEMVLGPEGMTAWKRGRSAEIRYRSRIDGPVVAFDMSLLGLTAALEEARGTP